MLVLLEAVLKSTEVKFKEKLKGKKCVLPVGALMNRLCFCIPGKRKIAAFICPEIKHD